METRKVFQTYVIACSKAETGGVHFQGGVIGVGDGLVECEGACSIAIAYRKSVVFPFQCGEDHLGHLFTVKITGPRLWENLIQLDPGICISAGTPGDSRSGEPL